jgi:hypothetical protein
MDETIHWQALDRIATNLRLGQDLAATVKLSGQIAAIVHLWQNFGNI